MSIDINYLIKAPKSNVFRRAYIKRRDVVTYADRRYSIGNVYLKNNFTLEKSSNPGYKYLRENGLESRMKYQKHKLPNLLETFNPDLTEWENMKVNGFDRIWDCGNLVFKFNEKLILTKVNNE